MVQLRARPTRRTFCIAASLCTGKVPGCPRQMGQTFTFGFFSRESLKQEQNILLFVFNSACISKPIVGVYFMLYLGFFFLGSYPSALPLPPVEISFSFDLEKHNMDDASSHFQ